jgi:hypothetical protein
MKQRILTGWNFPRVLYLLAGIMISVQSITERQWMGVALGLYFAAMGLFAFGCAGGNCYYQPGQKTDATIEKTKFEEIK